MIQGTHASNNRGFAKPETAAEKRRRLHREAAEDVKAYARALKEAKERYKAYDPSAVTTPVEEIERSLSQAGEEVK